MAEKPKAVKTGLRVKRTDTGEWGTYIDGDKGGHDVLLDVGPKVASRWEGDVPVEFSGARPRKCARCQGKGHHPFDCPVWDPAKTGG